MTTLHHLIGLRNEGARVYFYGDTYEIKERIKEIRGQWDPGRRQWWAPRAWEPAAIALLVELEGGPKAPSVPPKSRNPYWIPLMGAVRYDGMILYVEAERLGWEVDELRLIGLPVGGDNPPQYRVHPGQVQFVQTYYGHQCRCLEPTSLCWRLGHWPTLGEVAEDPARWSGPDLGEHACPTCGAGLAPDRLCDHCGHWDGEEAPR